MTVCTGVLKTNLWCCDYEWFSKVTKHLPSQDVEIVAGHGALSDLEVDVLGVQVVKARIVVVSRGIHVLKESFNMAS